jgi:predicted metal-dependent hydrolase
MGTVILDDDLKARLNGLNQHLEIRDTDGKLVGHYLPEEAYKRLLYDWANAEFAREEAEEAARGIDRKWDGTNGKTTAEVLASLKALETRLRQDEQQGAGQ